MRPINILFVYLILSGLAAAGDSSPPLAPELRGRWESVTFACTNFSVLSGATNVSLCVYGVGDWRTNSSAAAAEAPLDAELRLKDRTGRERVVSDSFGPAVITERAMLFGGPGGFLLNYYLTNDALVIEKHVALGDRTVSFRASLKKVSPQPGKRLQ